MSKSDLPTSFRLKRQVINQLELMRKGPRSFGFHPSGLARMCPVKYAVYERAYYGLGSDDPEVTREAMVMLRKLLDNLHDGVAPNRIPSHIDPDLHVGDAIHTGVQFWLGLRQVLWGRWECPWCRTQTGEGFMPVVQGEDIEGKPLNYPAPCQACRGQNLREKSVQWTYIEPWVGDDKWGITGHVDGILIINYKGRQFIAILEIKSINEAGYLNKYGDGIPKPEHVSQASQYVWTLRQQYEWLSELGHIYFIYVNKNAVRDWKEFLVPANAAVVAENEAKMQHVISGRGTDLPIAGRICSSVDDITARKCCCVVECFGREPSPINLFCNPTPASLPEGAVDVPL